MSSSVIVLLGSCAVIVRLVRACGAGSSSASETCLLEDCLKHRFSRVPSVIRGVEPGMACDPFSKTAVCFMELTVWSSAFGVRMGSLDGVAQWPCPVSPLFALLQLGSCVV